MRYMCTRMRRAMFLCGLIPVLVLMFWKMPAGAAQDAVKELEYGDGQKIYVLLPENYDPEEKYPSVYFMPQDGYSAQQYLYDGTAGKIRELEAEGMIPAMIYAFPQFRAGADPEEQIQEAISSVEQNYPAIPEASMRGVLGCGTGGYLAFLLGYDATDGSVKEEPVYFSRIASHDGDFTSERNPYIGTYGSLYEMLSGPVGGYGIDGAWLRNYSVYLDCNSDSSLAWAEGGSADLASLYRRAGLSDETNPSAWDYDVFEYAILSSAHYGTWMDNLARSLGRFAGAFYPEDRKTEEETETEYQVLETIVSGEDRRIDLMGEWYFITADALEEDDPDTDPASVADVLKTDWEAWDHVRPGLDWWTEDFASCLKGNPYYAGYAWYVREFEVPEEFDRTGLQVNAGMVDEADEVYLNGVRIGHTGIEKEGGSYDGSNPWDQERLYPIPEDLLQAGRNVIAVRVCNSSGAGGWYTGPIRIETAMEAVDDPAAKGQRFYTTSFSSKALKGQEIEYRVYVPEGYYESDLRYPVVYMLHGYGSTGKSFEIAGVPGLLDEGIASGEIPPCIVIFPSDGHPQKASWWSAAYGMMLNEDLIAQVDSTLRTVDSRDYRFLAGESMGGGGAYLNALSHPELYGGVFDIYGALRYTGALQTFLDMDEEQLGQFRHYIICGNHDMYCFDLDHILMGRHLTELKIPHVFEINSGEHSSSFYLPYLKEGFSYLLEGLEPVD